MATYLSSCLPTILPPYTCTYLPTCLPVFLSTYLPIFLHNYLSVYHSSYLSADLSAHQWFLPSHLIQSITITALQLLKGIHNSVKQSIFVLQCVKLHIRLPAHHPFQVADVRCSRHETTLVLLPGGRLHGGV